MSIIPVGEAKAIAENYQQRAVLVVALADTLTFVSYGQTAPDKVRAAKLSEEFQKFLGCDLAQQIVHEDFREPGQAAIIKEQRDVLLGALKEALEHFPDWEARARENYDDEQFERWLAKNQDALMRRRIVAAIALTEAKPA